MSSTPLEEPPDVLPEDESDMKPLIEPKTIPTVNVTGTGVCAVEMKPLTLRPASTSISDTPTPRQQTARHRKPFIQGGLTTSGTQIRKLDDLQKPVQPKKKIKISTDESSSNQGDALIELEEKTYTEWLAAQGLVSLGEEEKTVQLNIKVEDITNS